MVARKHTTTLVGALALVVALAVVVALAAVGWRSWNTAPSRGERSSAHSLTPGVAANSTAPSDPAGAVARLVDDRARVEAPTAPVDEPSAAPPSADGASGLTVIVLSGATGAPVPGTQLWALGDALGLEWTDARGHATFLGLTGTIELGVKRTSPQSEDTFVLVGGDGEPRDSVELHLPRGERHTVTIALTAGASIVGRVLDADGTALPGFRFLSLGADGDQWIEPRPVVTDDAGSFEVRGLAPGWYLLGPEPTKDDVFAYARMELARGERRDLTLQLLPAQQVRITVSVRGIARGEPCHLPVRYCLERADSLGEHVPQPNGRSRPRLWEDGVAPLTLERPLRVGPYVLRLASSGGTWTTRPSEVAGAAPRNTYRIAPVWEVALPFEVAAGTREIALETLAVEPGEVGVVELTVVHAEVHALAGRGSYPSVTMGWRDRSGEPRVSGLLAGPGTTTLTVIVDLDEVPDRALEIRSRVGSFEPQLVTAITLRPGTQRATADVTRQ